MIKWDPQKRITVSKILAHPYFNNLELPEELKAGGGGDIPIPNGCSHDTAERPNRNILSSSPMKQQTQERLMNGSNVYMKDQINVSPMKPHEPAGHKVLNSHSFA